MEKSKSVEPVTTPPEEKGGGMVPEIPETPDKYDVQIPELPAVMKAPLYREVGEQLSAYLEHAAGELKVLAHELQLPNTAAQKVVNHFATKFIEAFITAEEHRLEQREKALDALKAEWKDDFAANWELAKRTIISYGGMDLVAEIAAAGFADNPLMVRIFCNIGKALAAAL